MVFLYGLRNSAESLERIFSDRTDKMSFLFPQFKIIHFKLFAKCTVCRQEIGHKIHAALPVYIHTQSIFNFATTFIYVFVVYIFAVS